MLQAVGVAVEDYLFQDMAPCEHDALEEEYDGLTPAVAVVEERGLDHCTVSIAAPALGLEHEAEVE